MPYSHRPSENIPTSDPIMNSIHVLLDILKFDDDSRRILRLAVPFAASAIVYSLSDLAIMAIISRNLGTDAVVAYVMVGVVLGVSSSLTGGCVEAISSLGSMAYGAGNPELVGRYVRAAALGYALCELPFALVWASTIGRIVVLLGFDETAAVMAEDYVWIAIASNILGGFDEAFFDFLEVVERERYANVMYCIGCAIEVPLVAFFAIKMDADLTVLGLLILTCDAFFFFFNICVTTKMGWLKEFELGLLFGWGGGASTKDVLRELFKTALPLSIGSLLSYAEWEILTIFAAVLGPAEAVSWAILGSVWGVFEVTTQAIGDACEVHCAYRLGKGEPHLARLSAYKAMFLAWTLALVVTFIFWSMRDALLTRDPTIQAMLTELFPLIALGNVTMNVGMVCWSVVGAQGRYRLATTIATACSLLVTVPLGAVFTIYMRINLQGLTFAVVLGYSILGTILSTVLIMSDWEALSREIQDKVAADEEEEEEEELEEGRQGCINIIDPARSTDP